MFKINGPILAAMGLDRYSYELLHQAGVRARLYDVKFFACHVLSEIIAVRPLFPQLCLDEALKFSEPEAGVRDAIQDRIRTVTARVPAPRRDQN